MRAIIVGANGKMGKEIIALSGKEGLHIAGKVDGSGGDCENIAGFEGDADVIIEFALPAATRDTLEYAVKRKMPVVIGTTGHSREQLEFMRECGKEIAIFKADNFSCGIAAIVKALCVLREVLPDWHIEIVETHHAMKKDAPGGTAKMLSRVAGGAQTHSVRMGDVVGTHEIIMGKNSEIITLKHTAQSRSVFAKGAFRAAEFVIGKDAGLYGMDDLIGAIKHEVH